MVAGFQFIECPPERLRFVGADSFDEMHQGGFPASGVGGLIQRIDHQAGDELVTAVHGQVAMRAVVADLGDQILLG